jgi:hypothetical protein
MTPKFSFIAAVAGLALLIVPAGWGQSVVGPPDAFDRAVAAKLAQETTPIVSPDAFDRAVAAKLAQETTPIVSPDAVDRANAAREGVQSKPLMPDVFERTVAARNTTGRTLVFDDHRVTSPTSTSLSAPIASDSDREIGWPQIGIGFAIGSVLVLGLMLALRAVRIRPLTH